MKKSVCLCATSRSWGVDRRLFRRVGISPGADIRITALLVFLMSVSAAIAQLPTAAILGVVKDSTGAMVPNAALTARNIETGASRNVVSAGDGSFRFAALPVGIYEVRVEHPGFQTGVRSGLTLTVGQEAVVNFSLQVGTVAETVSVTAEAPLVNTTSGSLGGLVTEEKVADLPLNGRDFTKLTLLQPGIAQNLGGNQGQYSSGGAPLQSNNIMLDGAIMQTQRQLQPSTTLGIEGIREWRVVTNSFSAEYGLSMGSQMTIVSKSGTNSFHGSAFEFLRNDKLDARNFFDFQTELNPKRLPAFKRNNFGGSWGGPIRKDQMFFFLTYEGVRERLGLSRVTNTIASAVKVDGGLVPRIDPRTMPFLALYPEPNLPNSQLTFPASQKNTADYGQGRWDWTMAANDSFFGRSTTDNSQDFSPGPYPVFPSAGTNQNRFTTASETHILSPRLLNTFRFSYSRTNRFSAPQGLDNFKGPQFSFIPGLAMGSIEIGGVTTFGPNNSLPLDERQNIFTWSDDLFYNKGTHSLKFGSLINRYQQFNLNSQISRGTITFPNVQAFLLVQPSRIQAATPGSILDRTLHYTTLGYYFQDDWRVKPTITLNLGLRYEFHTNPVEAVGHGAALRDIRVDAAPTLGPFIQNPSLHNFSPRFGFAWDVRGDGKTALRGGFGLLYDIATLGGSFIPIAAGSPPFANQSTLSGTQAQALFNIPLFFPPEAAGKSARLLDYKMNQPHLLQYNLTVERQLPFHMALTVAYAGSRGINLLTTNEGNPKPPQGVPQNGVCVSRPAGQSFSTTGPRCWLGNEPRINPNWDTIELKTAIANSWYNALQVQLVKRLSKGLQFQSAYTWSHTLDNGTQNFLTSSSNSTPKWPVDPLNLRVDRGNSSFDITQVWHSNAIYRLPELNSSGRAPGKLLNGWWVSTIVSLQDGTPFTPVLQTNRSRSGVGGGVRGVDRPDLAPGADLKKAIRGGADRYYDPRVFAVPEAGFLGTAGRSILRGPGIATVDFTVAKDTAVRYLGESGKLEFRAEFFNILNRVNLQTPASVGGGGGAGPNVAAFVFAGSRSGEAPLPTVGRITGTSTSARQIQLALKLLF